MTRGPRENGHRPAVYHSFVPLHDPMGLVSLVFILSGVLDDGTAGWSADNEERDLRGSRPQDALSPWMPQSAIDNVEHQLYCSSLANGRLLVRLLSNQYLTKPETMPKPSYWKWDRLG